MSEVNIIWIDGTFGVGKTSVSRCLNNTLEDFVVLDSDEFYLKLSKINPSAVVFGGTLPQNNINFIRYFRKVIEDEIDKGTKNLIVVMAVTFEESRNGLLNYLEDKGINITHIILQASEAVLQDRILNDKDRNQNWSRQWNEWNLGYLEQHYFNAVHIDTDNMTPEDVAQAIVMSLPSKIEDETFYG